MVLKIFARSLWNRLPEKAHKFNSGFFSRVFIARVSKLFILPYCLIYGLSDDYLNYFAPESDATEYSSFNDFFKRKLKTFPESKSGLIWPCEGYVCDWGRFGEKMITTVKGTRMSPRSIFQASSPIPDEYYFTNVFLHNHNYHRVHAPVDGRIVSIARIGGRLNFLRPWIYSKEAVSLPALKNERLNVEIADAQNRIWHISMVGGFGVGTIKLNSKTAVGAEFRHGEELGWFELGSTVCLASPVPPRIRSYLQPVRVGADLNA